MTSRQNLFITGNSSGLGRGISQAWQAQGGVVYGCSRRGCDLPGVQDLRCDLADFEAIPAALETLLAGVDSLELVVLNAGVLGEIKSMRETSLETVRGILDINLFANKVILDWLHDWGRPVEQIVMISSGASVLGNKGWGGYALSKAGLNMLAKLYAHEFSDTHITALAPGLIDSAMMDYLCETPDPSEFPALSRLREARGTSVMPGPEEAGERVLSVVPGLREYPTGSFLDIRQILEPEEYKRLFGG